MPVPIKQSVLIIVLLSGLICYSCNCNPHNPEKVKAEIGVSSPIMGKNVIKGSFAAAGDLTFDSAYIRRFIDTFPLYQKLEKDLAAFYRSRNYGYAWFDKSGILETADNLYNMVMNIREEGLPDRLLYKDEFSGLMSANAGNLPDPMLELMLTSQYLVYGKLVWGSLSSRQLDSLQWLLPHKELTNKQLLDSLLTAKEPLSELPVYPLYAQLKTFLREYDAIRKAGGWGQIPAPRKEYKLGDSSRAIAILRHHLFLTKDLVDDTKTELFDVLLEQGIRNYQKRFGLQETGKVSASLVKEMNVPVEERINQIIVNMERTRWVPVNLTADYLLINIPDFKLFVYEKGMPVWEMNVVVGKNQHKTVVFNGELKYVVFSPYWNIPKSILRDEILPLLSRNPGYLKKNNMEWYGEGLRQRPGPDNPLGLVKFLFPNSHSIYLHDTPAKYLFRKEKRAFSHGCIRLEEAKKLAIYLLRNDPNWNELKISEAMNRGVEKVVTLKNPLPVFIAYFTAWVDKQGKINFRQDVYDRDHRLAEMIMKKTAL